MITAKQPVILILGGGTMQVPALRCARNRGWTVVMADGNPEPAGKDLAHYFENVDLRDAEGMIAMAASYGERTGLDGVFTAGTDFSLTVARVAEALSLPGISVETAEKATYKDRMRRCFREAGVPSPDFVTLGPEDPFRKAAEALPGPWVVKPVDNMGARGIRRVDSAGTLEEALRDALAWSGVSRAIVEEYMEGPEFSIDAIVEDGRITICGLADRHIFYPPHFIEMGHTMPSGAAPEEVDEVLRVFRLGVEALGIRSGCAKGDVKLTPRGGRVGEIAARLSGGYMSGWTYPYSSGVDLTGAALNLAVGRPAGDLTPRCRMHSAERAFISIPGIVESVEGLDRAAEIPGVQDVFLRVRLGDRVRFPRNNVEKCGNIITRGASRSEAAAAADRAASAVGIRLVPGEETTGRFLFGPSDKGSPSFYSADDVSGKDAADPYGNTVTDGLRRVEESGFRIVGEGGPEDLFRQALLRGGAEGVIWALRSYRQDPGKFLESVRLWSEG